MTNLYTENRDKNEGSGAEPVSILTFSLIPPIFITYNKVQLIYYQNITFNQIRKIQPD
jgi:hypothetical protein